jgi:FKBP-type peptidyl-prolyl cis-trans isomerase SlyD
MMVDKKDLKVIEDLVVTIEYELKVNGEVLDSSEEEGPLPFLYGHGNIIRGLENALSGMKISESKKLVIEPKDGYGEREEDAMMEVPREEFPGEVPVEVGIELEVTDKDGDIMLVTIAKVENEMVTLDTNHPLAGFQLHFDVKVIDIREATPEEIEHEHAHEDGHNHD